MTASVTATILESDSWNTEGNDMSERLALKIGDRVELRGNIGKVIEVSDKSLTIYCGDRKGRVPYTLGVSKKVFGREGQIL